MGCKTLLIDNYDSYTFNLFQLLSVVNGEPPILVQNDDFNCSWTELCRHLQPGKDFDNVVISPGPGSPYHAKDVGLCAELCNESRIPILGVCLGHQMIAHWLGAKVVLAPEPMHGRKSSVFHQGEHQADSLFCGIASGFEVVRYHSLVVEDHSLPSTLSVEARTKDGIVMALRRTLPADHAPCWGVQFHPESVATENGERLLLNFKKMTERFLGREFQQTDVHGSASLNLGEGSEMRKMTKVLVRELSGADVMSPQQCFSTVYSESKVKFWLDSASTAWNPKEQSSCSQASTQGSKQRGRFSYMGDARSMASEIVEFFVHPSDRSFCNSKEANTLRCELRVSKRSSSSSWKVESSRRDVDIFNYLESKLSQHKGKVLAQVVNERGEVQEEKNTKDSNKGFDFWCGYVGYFGYGLRKLCGVKSCGIASAWSEVKEMAHTSAGSGEAPQEDGSYQSNNNDVYVPDSAFIFADRMIVWDHWYTKCYVIALDNTEGNETEREELIKWMNSTCESLRQNSSTRGSETCPLSETKAAEPEVRIPSVDGTNMKSLRSDCEYKSDIRTCKEWIRNGETYEVCLTKQLVGETRVQPETFYQHLRSVNPSPYAAFLQLEPTFNVTKSVNRSSCFSVCSTSPERFLRIGPDRTVESKPIKGTIRRGITQKEDAELADNLRSSEKDRSENLMIVDLVRNDLGRVCTLGSVQVPKLLHIETYQTVHQLVSTVTGKIDARYSTMDTIRAAFPGGSMTGAPKLRTMQLIDQLEPSERGIYSGCLGFLSLSGAADMNIVIRTAVLTPNGVSIGTGGAIVSLSEVEEELEETKLKAQALERALQGNWSH